MKKRQRFKHTTSLQDRLVAFANEMRAKASTLPVGPERQALLEKAHQAESATQDDWIKSPNLQPLK